MFGLAATSVEVEISHGKENMTTEQLQGMSDQQPARKRRKVQKRRLLTADKPRLEEKEERVGVSTGADCF